jgi:hypothetical protein
MFEAYHGALNIARFGWGWGGLQDMATNPDAAAHPFLYVHHPNLGLYVSYFLRRLGVVSLEGQSAISIVGSAAGLLVAYAFVRKVTNSALIAAFVLGLFALDFTLISAWAFNIHRAFTYVSVFAAMYAFLRLNESRFHDARWIVASFVATIVLIGSDYMFYFFTGLATVTWVAIHSEGWRDRARAMLLVGLVFGAVFAVRQAQVAYGVGPTIWFGDFLLQVLNRLHLEWMLPPDWKTSAGEFYGGQAILNPAFSAPSNPIVSSYRFVSGTGEALLRDVLGFVRPKRALSTLAGTVFGLAVAGVSLLVLSGRNELAARVSLGGSVIAVAGLLSAIAINLGASATLALVAFAIAILILGVDAYRARRWKDIATSAVPSATFNTVVLGLTVFVPCVVLILVLPTYFGNWFSVFLLAPLCAVLWTAVLAAPILASDKSSRYRTRLLLAATALKVLSLAVLLATERPVASDHAEALRALWGIPTASNFTPASVAAYTQAFSGFLTPSGAEKLLSRGSVELEDYAMMFERDRANAMYRTPLYFVFYKGSTIFPGDWSFLSRFEPVREGNSFALYAVPSPERRR